MKRKAYIGLSSPTAYFYDNNLFKNEQWLWNPILESPHGLITLFDELWFLSRALCPITMREEKYVKFLDQDSSFAPLIKHLASIIENGYLDGIIADNPIVSDVLNTDSNFHLAQFSRYGKVIKEVYGRGPGLNTPIDNHSSNIDLCGFGVSGNSLSIDKIAFDIAMLHRMGVRNIELITNRFNESVFKNRSSTIQQMQIVQGITIKRIPVLQTPSGPVIDRIDSIRENNFLIDFRQKILNDHTPENYLELVDKIEGEFNNYRNCVLLEKQKSARITNSIANNAVSLALGSLIPGIGEIKSLFSDSATRKFDWTGFLAELEMKE